MIKGIGTDIEEVGRFKRVDDYFLRSVFTKREIDYCKKKKNIYECYAGKFCAKESIIKAYKKKITMRDIEILKDDSEKIRVFIRGKLLKKVFCSISHNANLAIAFVIIEI